MPPLQHTANRSAGHAATGSWLVAVHRVGYHTAVFRPDAKDAFQDPCLLHCSTMTKLALVYEVFLERTINSTIIMPRRLRLWHAQRTPRRLAKSDEWREAKTRHVGSHHIMPARSRETLSALHYNPPAAVLEDL